MLFTIYKKFQELSFDNLRLGRNVVHFISFPENPKFGMVVKAEGLGTVADDAKRQINHEFPFGPFATARRENNITSSQVPFRSEISQWTEPKSRVPFTSQLEVPENFL